MKKICILSSKIFEGKIFEDLLLRDELRKIYECDIVAWENVNEETINNYCVFVVRTVWGYHKNYVKFLSLILDIERRGKYVFNSYQNIFNNVSKYNQITFLRENNIPYVPTFFLKNNNPTNNIYNPFETKSFVIKPAISASGENTIKMDNLNLNNLYQIYDKILKDPNQNLLIQPYLETVENSEFSCIVIGNKFQYAVSRLPGVFTPQKKVEQIYELPHNMKNIVDIIIKKLKPLDLLFYRIDFFEYNNNYLVNEIEMIDPDLFIKRLDTKLQKNVIGILSNLIKEKIKKMEV